MQPMTDLSPHISGQPPILYFGTPVVLISTQNEDGTANLAPMSSAWWLGWRAMLGLANGSKTAQNLRRTGQCVLNLPSVTQVTEVDRLAKLTGVEHVPAMKRAMGYRYEPRKFETAGLTPVPSLTVAPPRALECPVQMEAVLCGRHDLMGDVDPLSGALSAFEMKITRVHLHPDILMDGNPDRIDPDKWRPLIMSFQKFYGLAPDPVHPSRLAEIDEAHYAVLRA